MKLEIVWSKKATIQFAEAITYIYTDSPQNALHLKNDIEKIIESLLKHPERFSPDKYKINNTKNEYRAFEKHRLRISYRFHQPVIRIVRVRHASRNPESY